MSKGPRLNLAVEAKTLGAGWSGLRHGIGKQPSWANSVRFEPAFVAKRFSYTQVERDLRRAMRSHFLRQAIERNLRHYQSFRAHLSAGHELGRVDEAVSRATVVTEG
jgi:hypothetical protein